MRLKLCLAIGGIVCAAATGLLLHKPVAAVGEDASVVLAVIDWAKAVGAADLARVRESSSRGFAADVWSKPQADALLARPESRRAGNVSPLTPRPVDREGEVARVRLDDGTRHLVFHCAREEGRWRVDDVTVGADGDEMALRETLRVVLAFLKEEKK